MYNQILSIFFFFFLVLNIFVREIFIIKSFLEKLSKGTTEGFARLKGESF